MANMKRVQADLITVFGATADLRSINGERAEELKTHYQQKQLAGATTYRRLKMARMFFDRAKGFKLIGENPFLNVRSKNSNPAERRHYVTTAETQLLIDNANPAWRIIIALARYAGLRCPSEVLSLKWENIDFAAGRMTVTSPKTEHHEGGGYRVASDLPVAPAAPGRRPRTRRGGRSLRRRRAAGRTLPRRPLRDRTAGRMRTCGRLSRRSSGGPGSSRGRSSFTTCGPVSKRT